MYIEISVLRNTILWQDMKKLYNQNNLNMNFNFIAYEIMCTVHLKRNVWQSRSS